MQVTGKCTEGRHTNSLDGKQSTPKNQRRGSLIRRKGNSNVSGSITLLKMILLDRHIC